jgi:hypothetical protein
LSRNGGRIFNLEFPFEYGTNPKLLVDHSAGSDLEEHCTDTSCIEGVEERWVDCKERGFRISKMQGN